MANEVHVTFSDGSFDKYDFFIPIKEIILKAGDKSVLDDKYKLNCTTEHDTSYNCNVEIHYEVKDPKTKEIKFDPADDHTLLGLAQLIEAKEDATFEQRVRDSKNLAMLVEGLKPDFDYK